MESARTGIPIITPLNPKHIKDMARYMDVKIPEPMSLEMYKKNKYLLRRDIEWDDKVLVDEVDGLLSNLLGAKVEKCTYTPDSINFNREYVGVWFDKEKEKNDMPTKYAIDPVGTFFINREYLSEGIFSTSCISRTNIITDVNILVPNKVVEVTFEDNTKEKAVCYEPDVFSLEQAIAICVAKHAMGGSAKFNNAVRQGMKCYETKVAAEEAAKVEAARIAKKKAKYEAYKKRKAEKMAQAEHEKYLRDREEMIEIQKEAYIRAMMEFD